MDHIILFNERKEIPAVLNQQECQSGFVLLRYVRMFDLFGNRTKFVRAHVWRDKTDFTYPEASLASLSDKADLGVAFSGGGTRSASAVAGQLRGALEMNDRAFEIAMRRRVA